MVRPDLGDRPLDDVRVALVHELGGVDPCRQFPGPREQVRQGLDPADQLVIQPGVDELPVVLDDRAAVLLAQLLHVHEVTLNPFRGWVLTHCCARM